MKQDPHPEKYPNNSDSYVRKLSAKVEALAEEIKIGKMAAFLFEKLIEENGKVEVSYLGENNLKIDPLTPILTLTLDDSIAEKFRSYHNVTADDLDKAASLITSSIVLSLGSARNSDDYYSDVGWGFPFSDDLEKFQMHLLFPNHYDGKEVMKDLRKHSAAIKNEILGGKLALQGNYAEPSANPDPARQVWGGAG